MRSARRWRAAVKPLSLSEQAVAAVPPTLAPPSFDGHGWLFVLNLFVMTAGFILPLMLAGKLAIDSWRCWRARDVNHDGWRAPIQLWRRIGFCMAFGFALRNGAEAYSLWCWNPAEVAQSAFALTFKRVLDPIAAGFGYAGLGQFFLALPGITEQLRKEPFPVSMWTSLPLLKRPAWVVLLCFIAATAVVVFR
ncbi:MAG: hypothetical protein PGN09_07720 [Sphingomonas fennica]